MAVNRKTDMCFSWSKLFNKTVKLFYKTFGPIQTQLFVGYNDPNCLE